jgi:hypothetical protein
MHAPPPDRGDDLTIRSLRIALVPIAAVVMLVPVLSAAEAASSADPTDPLERTWQRTHTPEARTAHDGRHFPLLAKASPDECYGGVGASYVAKTQTGCPSARQPKVNQAYVFGLTKSGGDLWFGTAPNTLCLVLSEIGSRFGSLAPAVNDAWSCEFGESGYRASLPDPSLLEPRLGDWRPPKLYRYRVATGALKDLGAKLSGEHLERLNTTLGLRSAGSVGRTVLLAGPALGAGGIGQEAAGVNMFAFDSLTGDFISSATLPEYSDIRQWIVVRGELYTAVARTGGGGALLRWNGKPDAPGTAADPSGSLFDFDEVGSLPAEGANLVEHRGRIYVTTWPVVGGQGAATAGLYQSREVRGEGLPSSDAQLKEIWTVGDDYEPDPLTAATYLGGAIASFDGRLVWGTMHAPLVAGIVHSFLYNADPTSDEVVQGAHRPTALFSAKNLESAEPRIRVLYGSAKLPAFAPGTGWRLVPNKANQVPKFGEGGFDNPFNLYTWTMGVTDRGLYVGTQDFNYVASKLTTITLDGMEINLSSLDEQIAGTQENPKLAHGADLLRFKSMRKPAVSVSRSGVGNFANYGIRTMIAEPDRLYLGTANPMNLLPEGGWEVRRLGPGLSLDLGAKRQKLGRKLRFFATASADATVVAKGKAIKRTRKRLRANEKTEVTAKLKPPARKRLANRLKRKRSVKVKIKATASTAAAGRATDRVKLKLKD